MNNKGQVLAIFVILIPVMIMAMALIIDAGGLLVRTTKVKSNIEQTIKYGLDNNDENVEEKMLTLLKINLGNDDNYSILVNDKITISVTGSYESILKMFKKDNYKYHYTYKGYKNNGKYVIEEEG